MNIVFLDVDGELTYSTYRNEDTEDIDIEKVKLVKKICDNTGAKVVISSSWRLHDVSYNKLVDILSNNGVDVIGKTIYIAEEFLDNVPEWIIQTNVEDYDFNIKFGTGRAAEIQQWINEHDVENFVILDDEDWAWSEYKYDKHWVQSSWFDGGLKNEHVEQAIKILKGNYKC